MVERPVLLDALTATGSYRARRRAVIPDVAGVPFAELSLTPKLLVARSMTALRGTPVLPAEQRAAALERAATMFVEDTIGGLTFAEYTHAVSRVSGVPVTTVRTAGRGIAHAARMATFAAYRARPDGAVGGWRDPATRSGRAVWTRRGEVLAVLAAGNHPGPNELWLEALALGYRVAVRPSRREPFTPHRLVWALRAAGFGAEQVLLLPTDHDAADEVLDGADRSIVYGGDDVVRKYATDSRVLTQGPGRSKILVTADADWRRHLDTIVDSIAHHGGVACLNTTAVLVEGDPGPLARALAERLGALPSLPPEHEDARLAVQHVDGARRLEKYLFQFTEGTRAWTGGDGIVDELGDGSAVLRPAVHQLDRLDVRTIGVELPFPCVWVAPWTREDGVAALRNTLVLTALTGDDTLFDALVDEPSISNVYRGDHPTYWIEPGVPHDGFLGEFLMKSKTVIRD
ncbi:aldehyde dehydrogenase family protein [Krasilnikovia sp. M28-CT-15]|uniref:aldehyde dehydrogenase family protein n=1 Tax=Krasilnikovia sp. M28-CT-15 TaxID=3373540 RepID=UPI00387779F3